MASARSPAKPITSHGTVEAATPAPSTTTSMRPPSRIAETGPATSTRRPRIAVTRPKVSRVSTVESAASAAASPPEPRSCVMCPDPVNRVPPPNRPMS